MPPKVKSSSLPKKGIAQLRRRRGSRKRGAHSSVAAISRNLIKASDPHILKEQHMSVADFTDKNRSDQSDYDQYAVVLVSTMSLTSFSYNFVV